jgi:hypothetical protein
VSAASCCGDFTNEAPISPPAASNAAAMPTPSSIRRRRVSRDPRTAWRRPLSLLPPPPGPLPVAGEPSCVTRFLRCLPCYASGAAARAVIPLAHYRPVHGHAAAVPMHAEEALADAGAVEPARPIVPLPSGAPGLPELAQYR